MQNGENRLNIFPQGDSHPQIGIQDDPSIMLIHSIQVIYPWWSMMLGLVWDDRSTTFMPCNWRVQVRPVSTAEMALLKQDGRHGFVCTLWELIDILREIIGIRYLSENDIDGKKWEFIIIHIHIIFHGNSWRCNEKTWELHGTTS